jgi:general secretion pathway protein A
VSCTQLHGFAGILFCVSNPAGPQIDPSPAEKFFGLSARPFSLTPDLRFAYHSRSHTHALEQVTAALRRREGLIVVTGAIGTGKTMLCRSMLESFESRTFLSVILDPGLEVEDLLRQVLADFGLIEGVDPSAPGPMSEITRHQYVSTLHQFLGSLIPLQAHAVIMIDEAQRLNPRVLEEIRLLSNFETDEAKLLQIVLVGQPDLDEMLRHPKMQQLNQRVARRCELYPLSETEVGDYIERRLTVAASPVALVGGIDPGLADTANVVRFSPAAVKTVAGISGGIPRLINTLCDRALEAAYERQIRTVDPDAVTAAAERLHLEVPGSINLPGRIQRTQWIAAGAAAVLFVVAALWWLGRPATTPAASRRSETPASRSTQTTAPAPSAVSPATGTAPGAGGSPPRSQDAGTPPQTAPPAVVASTPAAAAAASVPSTTASGAFQIAVAAFRTESRAQEVAKAVGGMQIPATVRLDPTGAWYRVLAGPFPTREAAQAAQDALAGAGYDGTQISQSTAGTR